MRPARLLTLLVALCAVSLATACGQEPQDRGGFQTENAQVAETEAVYVTLDGMKYQVQISRQLNPLLIDDRDYLDGSAESELEPSGGSTQVRLITETETPRLISDKLMESIAKGWFKRKQGKALRRLRRILEDDEGRGARATIAGGGPRKPASQFRL